MASVGDLFTPAEKKAWTVKEKALDTKRHDKTLEWNSYWAQIEALRQAKLVTQVKRAQARAEEYLSGLIILVGNRGAEYVDFDTIFAKSDSADIKNKLAKANTPETRRALYTVLMALTEVPKSWATSAFLRFLRGSGKQKDAKYHGAGTFGVLFGWKEDEVKTIAKVMTGGHNPYSEVLMSYADVMDEIRDAESEDPDYKIEYSTRFVATRVERDKKFLTQLCEMLEKQGLGPVPVPEDAKPKKDRIPKQFKPGDIIRKSNLRDLPLPAHVRIPIERRDDKTTQFTDATIEHVVGALYDNARYECAVVPTGSDTAFRESETYSWGNKSNLDGATFLGVWKGKMSKKTMRVNFYWRAKNRSK